MIVMLRRLDMPLTQVAEIISAPGPEAAERLAAYWNALEQRVAGQRELAVASVQPGCPDARSRSAYPTCS